MRVLAVAVLAGVLCACLVSGCSLGASVAFGSITGVVRDAVSGTPINTAVVTARQGSTIVTTTTTDANGVYTIEDVDPGTYALTATKAGYDDGTISVNVSRGTEASGKNFALQPTG